MHKILLYYCEKFLFYKAEHTQEVLKNLPRKLYKGYYETICAKGAVLKPITATAPLIHAPLYCRQAVL